MEKKSDSISLDRVFEYRYTKDALCTEFMPSGQLNSQKIASIPAILTSELRYGNPAIADIGVIHSVRISGKSVYFSYSVDSDLPRLTNEDLKSMSNDLGKVNINTEHKPIFQKKGNKMNIYIQVVVKQHFFCKFCYPG